VSYGLVMLFGSTTRKRIVSSGLCSSTGLSLLSYVRLVSTSPTRFAITLPVDRLVERLSTTAD
jgi:hypothetical protein